MIKPVYTNMFTTSSDKVNFRSMLIDTLFRNQSFINDFIEYFKSNFSTIKEEYDSGSFTYTFKIKKTKIKKHNNYYPHVDFYYPYIANILVELFSKYDDDIIVMLINDQSVKDYCKENGLSVYRYAYDTLDAAKADPIYFADVLCISDNTVQIRM